jgi:hypothetical protein
MCDHELRSEAGHRDGLIDRIQPEWAHRATTARVAEWSSDRVLDPGDTHDKGEPSLCVGEAV